MNTTVETIDYKGFTIEIYTDETPEDPREWDNLGIMVRTGYGAGVQRNSADRLSRAVIVDDLAAAAEWIAATEER